MSFHHVALATNDLAATHRFYTEVMGFELVKVQIGPTENAGGWAKHVFYDTGGDGMIAFWELHDEAQAPFETGMSSSVGLPVWVNHLAFAATLDELPARRDQWLDNGIDVFEIDHGFCVSIYAMDPNGTLVEWCADARVLDAEDRAEAERLLLDPAPAMGPPPTAEFHAARTPASI